MGIFNYTSESTDLQNLAQQKGATIKLNLKEQSDNIGQFQTQYTGRKYASLFVRSDTGTLQYLNLSPEINSFGESCSDLTFTLG